MVRARQQAEKEMSSRMTASESLDVIWTSTDCTANRVDTVCGLFQAIYGESNDPWIT